MKKLLLILVAALMATPALADFNNTFPRTRFFSELGRPSTRSSEGSERRRVSNVAVRDIDVSNDEHYSLETPRFGVYTEFASNFLYRDFAIVENSMVGAYSIYGSFYGVEGSIFSLNDLNDDLGGGDPLLMEYRLSYSMKLDTSINTVSFTYQDWSNSASKIGTVDQGFGSSPPIFEDNAMEVGLSSYWFNEKIQPNNMNFFLGFDAKIWIDEPGFRTAATAGVFANKESGNFLPNGARLQASAFVQSDYHTDNSSIPGFEAYVETYWDLRYSTDSAFPLMIMIFGQYYLPATKDPVDLITFGGRIEFLF